MDFSQEIFDKICQEISTSAKSLKKILSEEGMPNTGSLFRWIRLNEETEKQYARAREAQADLLAEEILEISDDGANDTYTKDGQEMTNHDVIARSRLRVDSRKWLASKLKPKKYGDKTAVEHSGSVGLSGILAEIDGRSADLPSD